MSSEAPAKLTLRASDGREFEVESAVALVSATVRNMVEDGCAGEVIPLPNVTGKTLEKVLEYCRRHAECCGHAGGGHWGSRGRCEFSVIEEPLLDEVLKEWEDGWASELQGDQDALFRVIMAANYMEIGGLLDRTCRRVAKMMSACKTPEEIRRNFNIQNDYTPEEEAEVRREHACAWGVE